MQKSTLIFIFILFVNLVQAQLYVKDNEPKTSTISIQPKIGYSVSKTTFNISGNELGKNPNILSELIWDPTNAIEYGLDLKFSHDKFILNTSILLNNTISGNVTDFDYDGDNRTLPYTQLYLSNHKGSGLNFKIQPGYNWSKQDNLKLITYASFDHSSRTLYLLNDKDWRTNDRNYISGLNSYYNYKFPSYGIGIQVYHDLSKKITADFGIEGYLSKYYAYGNWNLIEAFEKPISYEHKGNGKKISTNLGVAYNLGLSTSIGIQYNLNHFNINNGRDYLYHKEDGVLKTRLNEANETKHSIFLNLRHSLAF
ncbi:hypothetical protein [Sphingobacterium bovistauri]|uniref:Protochlamydia outer membrane protein domain-containing protein n=1 Tax=Sphingobacterium bovistauri TaxID=2781959 RepID=A0ABS7Z314_9SPHI|nr:hypothetical protein [Sphingobacterium bovistauri]MCA5004552.1 hypothetical protein [Sphingobacterium bovistauri]